MARPLTKCHPNNTWMHMAPVWRGLFTSRIWAVGGPADTTWFYKLWLRNWRSQPEKEVDKALTADNQISAGCQNTMVARELHPSTLFSMEGGIEQCKKKKNLFSPFLNEYPVYSGFFTWSPSITTFSQIFFFFWCLMYFAKWIVVFMFFVCFFLMTF